MNTGVNSSAYQIDSVFPSLDVIQAFGCDSCKATMLKHLAHWHKSHDVTALHKAEWYRSQLVERDATKEATVHAQ
jgi:hypothetical protein